MGNSSDINDYAKIMRMKMYKKWISILILMLSLALGAKHAAASSNASPLQQSGGDVIAAINSYRAANGLAQLSTNAILTSVAQNQANYQASIQTVTHTGPGGSTARDRAIAAGYSGGSITYLSEIIYGGMNATVAVAMTWWQNSSVHNSVMLAARYTEIGAGVAVSGDTVYFTAVLATPGSSSGVIIPTTASSGSTGDSSTDDPNPIIIMPVQIATPQADGSIIHEVQEGQTIWTIEAVYGLEPGTLQKLNELPSYPYVFPGDELIIQPAGSPSAAVTPATEETGEAELNSAAKTDQVIGTPYTYVDPAQVTPTPPIVITKPPRATATNTAEEVSQAGFFLGNSTAKTIAIIALLILAGVMIGSAFLQNPPTKPSE